MKLRFKAIQLKRQILDLVHYDTWFFPALFLFIIRGLNALKLLGHFIWMHASVKILEQLDISELQKMLFDRN